MRCWSKIQHPHISPLMCTRLVAVNQHHHRGRHVVHRTVPDNLSWLIIMSQWLYTPVARRTISVPNCAAGNHRCYDKLGEFLIIWSSPSLPLLLNMKHLPKMQALTGLSTKHGPIKWDVTPAHKTACGEPRSNSTAKCKMYEVWSKTTVKAAAECDPTERQGSSIQEAARRTLVTVCDKF